jgi:hypothetical protein
MHDVLFAVNKVSKKLQSDLLIYNYINETHLGEFSAHATVPDHLQITTPTFLYSISDMINQKFKTKAFICFILPLP